MKKINYFLVVLFAMVMASCGGSKPAVAQNQDVEITVPCSGPEFMTNKEYFRANAMGLSTDMTIAKKKAMSSVRTEIAAAVNATVKAVTDDYASSYQQGENDESKRRFQELSRLVVQQELSGVRVICEKTMKSPDGKYKVYVAAELAGQEIMDGMAARMKNDEKLRIDFEYEKFKKVFEEEMSKSAQ